MADPISAFSTSSGHAGPNLTSWYNLTAWTVNVTRYAPSLEDIVWAGPRMFMKLGSFVAFSEPFNVASTQQFVDTPPTNSDPLRPLQAHSSIYNAMEPIASPITDADPVSHVSRLSVDGARGLGSVFSYATSKWAISCIAMAIILNRTHIFAATRRRSRFRWHIRAILRLLPVLLLVLQARSLLRSIQCQTSPDFSLLRWGNATRSSDLMFSHKNTGLNTLSSILLFGASDQQSCTAIAMTPATRDNSPQDLRGSLSILWPLFGTFCLSHFLETLSCAVQGRAIAAETGMTLFEQSLAFAEADAAVSNQLGWGTFSSSQPINGTSNVGTTIALTRSMILRRVNTSPEVLLVALLSTLSHITSHVLGIFDLQAKYRLINTGFWGLCFMGSIVWSVIAFDLDEPASQGLLRFPTVCIIGFVPHVLVLGGILVCSCIYSLALVVSALASAASPEFASMTFRQRIAHAHENMQANVSLSEIRINREMDFYTALLRTGFAAITMASEAVYLNEDRGVSLKQHTWLEEARLREAEEMHKQWIGMGLPSSKYDQIGAIGLIPVKGGPLGASNGYARERAAQKVPKGRERGGRAGIGATERSSRWLMALEFILSINKLLAKLFAIAALRLLALFRIRAQPAWLLWLAHRPKPTKNNDTTSKQSNGRNGSNQTSLPTDGGLSSNSDGLDVEAEFRRVDRDQDDEVLDKDLYNYWLKGGWWGSNDSSGDFTPEVDDDWDKTSVITMSTYGDETDDEGGAWTSDDEGQKTPTQMSPQRSRQSTPAMDSPLHIGDLARLLHPQSSEEREEAMTLSAHFQSERIMTRSQFRRLEQLKRTRILTVNPPRSAQATNIGRPAKLSPEDEERLLEQLLLARRQSTPQDTEGAVQWQQGAAGMGGDGPQCVVCQCSPRTIIVWPCRCLSLCDDCRVSLAMNNFDKCVCCRREVISFSRIFVP